MSSLREVALDPALLDLYCDLHRHPELGYASTDSSIDPVVMAAETTLPLGVTALATAARTWLPLT